jgi:general stress protein 26
MGYHHEEILFLKERIEEVKIAFFKAEPDSVLQLPNNIISTLRVDDSGYIWFFTSCTHPYAQYLDKELYVLLDYYQKGNNCLQINGKAFIEKATEDFLNFSVPAKNVLNQIVMLKVKILKAEYFETKSSAKISIMDKIKSAFTHLLSSNPYRMYDFSS